MHMYDHSNVSPLIVDALNSVQVCQVEDSAETIRIRNQSSNFRGQTQGPSIKDVGGLALSANATTLERRKTFRSLRQSAKSKIIAFAFRRYELTG